MGELSDDKSEAMQEAIYETSEEDESVMSLNQVVNRGSIVGGATREFILKLAHKEGMRDDMNLGNSR